jgi:hypothetical protein
MCHLITPDRDIKFKICGDLPHRGSDFVDLLPGITNLGYGRSYMVTKNTLLPPDFDLESLESGTHQICLNPYLESGRKLGDTFQQTDYHFKLNITNAQIAKANKFIQLARSGEDTHPVIGFYCSSYAHRGDLGFWSVSEWMLFLKMIQDILPTATFVALGAKYDDRTFEVYTKAIQSGMNVTSALGTADVGTTIHLIKRLDYFFAFPSGLGILADVVDTPCMMWYWSNLIPANQGFLDSYADPVNVLSKRHINLPYIKVLPSVDVFVEHGLKYTQRKKK